MNLRFNVSFWLVVALQMVVLLAMIGAKEVDLRTGMEVTLETVPVDPRSLFQGDYVILRYAIGAPRPAGSLPRGWQGEGRPKPGTAVYVALREAGDIWAAGGYHLDQRPDKPVVIRGVITNEGWLDFGIGTYFVPEGTGRAIERAEDVRVKVVVAQDGGAVIKEVLVDGEPFQPKRDNSETQQP